MNIYDENDFLALNNSTDIVDSELLTDDTLREECGIVGVYSKNQIASRVVHLGLIALQHRGQESAGIVTFDEDAMYPYKNMGLVQEVFSDQRLNSLKGNIGIGHVRYSTTGRSYKFNAQPLSFTFKGGNIALAHNGNIVNAEELKMNMEDNGAIFRTSIDTEVVAHLIAKNYDNGFDNAILKAVKTIKGAFALIFVCDNKLIGVRDPNGIRPMVLGRLDDGYVLASESVALDVLGAQLIRDIEAGEMVIIDENGVDSIRYSDGSNIAHSSFEYVYFARPDSVIDGKSVYETRKRAGEILAKNYPCEADVVIPVPDSGRGAALGYAAYSGIPYEEGLIKNKYVGRTFIQPTQELREMAVRLKLNVLKASVEGKRVVLIDDSIVRSTTSRKIVSLLRKAGAKEIHLRISSPPVKYPSFYGIDTPSKEELIAATKSVDEIKDIIGVDSLCYLTVDELVEAIGFKREQLCMDVFTGEYPVEIPEYLLHAGKKL